MKKFVALLLVCVTLFTFAYAEVDGVFVPSYQSFMASFYEELKGIDTLLAEALYEECYKDGKWKSSSIVYTPYHNFTFSPSIQGDYIYAFDIRCSWIEDGDNEAQFKAMMIAATKSLVAGKNDDVVNDLFESIHYDYVMESPAKLVSTEFFYGVYRISLTKSSTGHEFSISKL